jgi:phage-related protein
MKNSIVFYETLSGTCPVAKFLEDLSIKHHAKAVRNLELLEEFGQSLQGGIIAHVQEDIWELRIGFANDISRILYINPIGNIFILLHGFIKKTPKTPQREINIATKRMKDYMRRINDENITRTHKRTT